MQIQACVNYLQNLKGGFVPRLLMWVPAGIKSAQEKRNIAFSCTVLCIKVKKRSIKYKHNSYSLLSLKEEKEKL